MRFIDHLQDVDDAFGLVETTFHLDPIFLDVLLNVKQLFLLCLKAFFGKQKSKQDVVGDVLQVVLLDTDDGARCAMVLVIGLIGIDIFWFCITNTRDRAGSESRPKKTFSESQQSEQW